MASRAKEKKAHLILRGAALFLVCLVIGAALYRWGYHHYTNVATWGADGTHASVIYEDTTYRLAGKLGTRGMTASVFPTGELLGEVTPNSLFDPKPAYVVYSVEEKADYLLVTGDDGEKYVYYRDGVENPAKETEEGWDDWGE